MEWEPDTASPVCRLCNRKWGVFSYRRHHCRNCGKLVCYKCSTARIYLTIKSKQAERVCDKCAERIHSTEGTPLAPGALDEEDEADESDAEIQSVISDGKCKATETPFRNTMSLDRPPAQLTAMVRELQEVDEEVVESEGDDDDEGSFGSPEAAGAHTLNLEEMHLHRSHSEIPVTATVAPSEKEFGTGDAVHNESAHHHHHSSVLVHEHSLKPDHTLKSTVSKFGVMTFSDDERSADERNSMRSEDDDAGEVKTYSASELPQEFGLTAAGNRIDETASRKEKGDSERDEFTAVHAQDGMSEGDISGSSHAESSATAVEEAPVAAAARTEEATVNPDTAASAETNAAEPTAKNTTPKTRKIVLGKKSSPARAEMDANASTTVIPSKLPSGLSPVPPSNAVRRLSALTPRTPFNSAVTMSPAAAEIAAAQAQALAEAAAAQAAAAQDTAPAAVTAESGASSESGSEESATPSNASPVPATEVSSTELPTDASVSAPEAPLQQTPAEETPAGEAIASEDVTQPAPENASEAPGAPTEETSPAIGERASDLESLVSTESGERKSASKRGGRKGRNGNRNEGNKVGK